MPGRQYSTFREGNRSEYLAGFLMSGLGLVTPVPRQEDIGIDFYCSIADQEEGNLTFNYPYSLQIKSFSNSKIEFGRNNKKEWVKEEIFWLCEQELPLFIGIVNKEELRIDIFNTSTLWFIINENDYQNCGKIVLVPRMDSNNNSDIGRPEKILLEDCPDKTVSDGSQYGIDLGKPIISFSNDDLYDKEKLREIKAVLRETVQVIQNNIIYQRLNLPFFFWILRNSTNKSVEIAFWAGATGRMLSDEVLEKLSPTLISLYLCFNATNEKKLLKSIKPIIKRLPPKMIYPALRQKLPDLFDF